MSVPPISREMLTACCGAKRWVGEMLASQPFESATDLHARAESIWWSLSEADWLEAFASHPKIGERAKHSGASSDWSRQEQSRAETQDSALSDELMRLNREYEERYGFIFIICATGKSAGEILAALKRRLHNAHEEEIRIAAAEQAKIMHLRLDKLFEAA